MTCMQRSHKHKHTYIHEVVGSAMTARMAGRHRAPPASGVVARTPEVRRSGSVWSGLVWPGPVSRRSNSDRHKRLLSQR